MDDRSSKLQSIRPTITTTKVDADTRNEEYFQNESLRPIIKLQNPLLLAAFKNYVRKHKNRFYELNVENRLLYIERAIQKDIKFRNSLKGMIIGQFTLEEYTEYIQNSSALNKRMMNMVIARIKDQVQLLESDVLIYQ
ncbi:MAG: glyoxalase [Flavobacteriaceae bacterium]|nr:glyoxalase [Flavobacteriaceae bacterium]